MGTVVRSTRRGAVALLTLDGPDRLNAIGQSTLAQLRVALADVAADSGVRAVVITGAGKAFSAGADLSEIGSLAGPAEFADSIRAFTDTYALLDALRKPTIASIDGIAFGGGLELALACDLRVGSRTARLGLPEIKLGLLPGAGGTQRISRLLPTGVAKELLLTGEALDADRAFHLGLLNEVTEPGKALDAALVLADKLVALAPLALAAAKDLVADGRELPLDAAVVLERDAVARLFGTNDRVEGIAAFREKRPPAFRGD
jgi:enoyl-CoA hydratase